MFVVVVVVCVCLVIKIFFIFIFRGDSEQIDAHKAKYFAEHDLWIIDLIA